MDAVFRMNEIMVATVTPHVRNSANSVMSVAGSFSHLFLSFSLCLGQMMMSAGPRGAVAQNPGMPQVSSVMEDEILMDLI